MKDHQVCAKKNGGHFKTFQDTGFDLQTEHKNDYMPWGYLRIDSDKSGFHGLIDIIFGR